MTGHTTLGLANVNGRPGLGLVRETNTAAAAASVIPPVSRETTAAPVVGVERTQIGSPADLAASAPAPAAAPAQPKSAIAQFKDNPIGAIGIILQEIAAGMKGTEGPVAFAEKQAIQRQGLQLRAQAATLDGLESAIKTIPRLTPDQIERYVENFPDIEGTGLKATVKAFADGELEGLDQTVAGLKADPFATMFMGSFDMTGKSPAEVQKIADEILDLKIKLQGKKIEETVLREGKVETAAAIDKSKQKLRSGLGGAVIDVNTDEVVTPGAFRAIDNAGNPVTIPIRTAEELQNLTDRLASGELTAGSVQRTQQVEAIPGGIRILLPDLPANLTAEQARQAGVNIDLRPQTIEGLLENRGDAIQLDATFTELQQSIDKNPGIVGTTGFFARMGNSIMAQLPLLAQLTGVEFDPELAELEKYESTFERLGVESQRAKSATFGAAYALALAQRQRGGRVAQQDIERALLQIGGTFGQDPEATIQTLQDIKVRTAEGFETRAEALLGKAPEKLAVTPRPKKQSSGLIELREQSEVDLLASGTDFFWLPTNEVLTKE
jgi:hypothetical protein